MTINQFDGTVVMVTGGGSAIGAAVAHRFASDGAVVVVVGRVGEELQETVAAAPAGAEVTVRVADVADESAITVVVEEVAGEHGRLDVLVNSAGSATIDTFTVTGRPSWRHVMAVAGDGVLCTSAAALRHLRAVGGNIVNVGSGSAAVPAADREWGMPGCRAARGTAFNLTDAMALDYASEGVRVNAVHAPPAASEVAGRIPLQRAAGPAEVADAVAFLAGREARFVTGAHLPLDGGLRLAAGNLRLSPCAWGSAVSATHS